MVEAGWKSAPVEVNRKTSIDFSEAKIAPMSVW